VKAAVKSVVRRVLRRRNVREEDFDVSLEHIMTQAEALCGVAGGGVRDEGSEESVLGRKTNPVLINWVGFLLPYRRYLSWRETAPGDSPGAKLIVLSNEVMQQIVSQHPSQKCRIGGYCWCRVFSLCQRLSHQALILMSW
jgi:hypothetical protein